MRPEPSGEPLAASVPFDLPREPEENNFGSVRVQQRITYLSRFSVTVQLRFRPVPSGTAGLGSMIVADSVSQKSCAGYGQGGCSSRLEKESKMRKEAWAGNLLKKENKNVKKARRSSV